MASNYSDEYDWRDFDTLNDYVAFRLGEGMEGHDYSPLTQDTVAEWAEIFIDQHDWDRLQKWMEWDKDEMADFFDWWREMYESA